MTGALPAGYAVGGAAAGGASAAATGVSAAGSAAVTGGAAILISMAKRDAVTLGVDLFTTDLEMGEGGSAGWLNYDNTPIDGMWVEFVGAEPTWGQTTSFTYRVYQNRCVGTYNSFYGSQPCQTGIGWVYLRSVPVGGSGSFTSGDFGALFSNGTNSGVWREYREYTHTFANGFERLELWVGGSSSDPATHIYYPQGHPDRPEEPQAGFVGTFEETYECRDGSGAITPHVIQTPVVGMGETVNVDLPAFECPPGETLVSALIEWVTDAGRQTVYDYTAPEWVYDTPTEWPGCVDGSCELSLWVLTGGTKYVSCGQYAVGCPDWWQDPDKIDNYECRYGPYVVELGMCSVFRKPGKVSPNVKVDTDPGTGKKTFNPPVESLDPDDYKKFETPDPDPVLPDPPGPVPPPGPDPSPDPNETDRCFPTGWSSLLNPIQYVLQPVKCALVWAFVPRTEVVTANLTETQSALDEHGILRVVTDASEVPSAVSGSWDTSCSPIGMDLGPTLGNQELKLPCSASAALGSGSGYSVIYTVMTGAIVIATGWGGFLLVRAHFGGKGAT